ncbi:MAG: OmpA family protein [Myxococcales bacterium]|nr:OmpA family protein [Myxococcales bacterium]
MSVVLPRSPLGPLLIAAALWLGACGPTYPNCDGDDNCKSKGEYCVEKKCVQCRLTSHCANATTDACVACDKGQCVRKQGCCANNLDCSAGKKCSSNKCVNQCASDADCTGGKMCNEQGACVSPDASGCSTDADCGGKLKCKSGKCVNSDGLCELVPINFDFNRSNLSRASQNTISANARCFKERKVKSITVEGHCDERGTDAYNLELGNRRARAVKRYLKGVSRRLKVRTVSYGKARPTCNEASESCWSENRRAEFKAR